MNKFIVWIRPYDMSARDSDIQLELPIEEDELKVRLEKYEEWQIVDHEGFPFQVEEYADIYTLNRLAKELQGYDSFKMGVYEAALNHNGNDYEEALDLVESGDYFVYHAENNYELGEAAVEEGGYPPRCWIYIDEDSVRNEIESSWDLSEDDDIDTIVDEQCDSIMEEAEALEKNNDTQGLDNLLSRFFDYEAFGRDVGFEYDKYSYTTEEGHQSAFYISFD